MEDTERVVKTIEGIVEASKDRQKRYTAEPKSFIESVEYALRVYGTLRGRFKVAGYHGRDDMCTVISSCTGIEILVSRCGGGNVKLTDNAATLFDNKFRDADIVNHVCSSRGVRMDKHEIVVYAPSVRASDLGRAIDTIYDTICICPSEFEKRERNSR